MLRGGFEDFPRRVLNDERGKGVFTQRRNARFTVFFYYFFVLNSTIVYYDRLFSRTRRKKNTSIATEINRMNVGRNNSVVCTCPQQYGF